MQCSEGKYGIQLGEIGKRIYNFFWFFYMCISQKLKFNIGFTAQKLVVIESIASQG